MQQPSLVYSHLQLPQREVALAAVNAVPGAAAAAQAVGQHAAEVLQRAAGDFVVAAAMDLAAVRRLFEFDRAARQHAPIGARRRAGRNRAGLKPWIGPENGATADEPRSNSADDDITQTPSKWPINERRTQEEAMLPSVKPRSARDRQVYCETSGRPSQLSQPNEKCLPIHSGRR